MAMIFDINFLWAHKEIFLQGLAITLELSVLVIIFGTALGLLVAFGKRSTNHIISRVSSLYADFFRVMPFLIMLIWVYYALPIATGIRIGAFETSVLVLSLHLSAYVGELIRSGIETLPKGQVEAAIALGLTRFQTTYRIVLPQVLRQVLSPLAGLYVEQIKNTTLVSIIAVGELLHSGQILISQTYRPLEVYTAIALIFIVILAPIALAAKKLELSAFVRKAECASA